MKRGKRRSFFDEIFGEMEKEFERFEKFFQESEVGDYGYSINVTESGGKTKVYVKAGKNVDASELKKMLRERYPGAEIIVEGGKPLIEEVEGEKKPTEAETYRIPVEGAKEERTRRVTTEKSKTDEKRRKSLIEPL
ncbi:hypothetical protein KEJ25_02505 [Candidatus Bathyarchaeota archaeon]|nr:hypothetical protein [Candidatus Bathyarchaeota archaeon]